MLTLIQGIAGFVEAIYTAGSRRLKPIIYGCHFGAFFYLSDACCRGNGFGASAADGAGAYGRHVAWHRGQPLFYTPGLLVYLQENRKINLIPVAPSQSRPFVRYSSLASHLSSLTSPCPMPHAPCSMLHAPCSMLHVSSPCSMPHALRLRCSYGGQSLLFALRFPRLGDRATMRFNLNFFTNCAGLWLSGNYYSFRSGAKA